MELDCAGVYPCSVALACSRDALGCVRAEVPADLRCVQPAAAHAISCLQRVLEMRIPSQAVCPCGAKWSLRFPRSQARKYAGCLHRRPLRARCLAVAHAALTTAHGSISAAACVARCCCTAVARPVAATIGEAALRASTSGGSEAQLGHAGNAQLVRCRDPSERRAGDGPCSG